MAYDLQSTVTQSAANKLINSVQYPFTVFERKSPYEGLDLSSVAADSSDELLIEFDDAQHTLLLDEINNLPQVVYEREGRMERSQLAEETRQALDEIAANARECQIALQAHTNATETDKPAWDGPTQAELTNIIDVTQAETLELAKLRKVLGDWDITPLITWIRVDIREAPTFNLGGLTIALGIKVATDGTGEVWLKHPWFKCIKKWHGICYQWKKIVKHTLLLRVTLRGIKVRAKAKAELSTQGALIMARGKFDELRIDHRYLDQIPIEKIANKSLSQKPITVFDASTLVATVPVLNSRFTVDTINIPNLPGAISVEVTLKQL